MLEVKELNVGYGQSEVIHSASFNVEKGEILAIMGRNGMGKTTLLKSLMGVLHARSGSVKVDGTDVSGMPPHRRVRSGMAYVPQGRMIFGTLSVLENLVSGAKGKVSRSAFDEIYALFPVLFDMRKRRGGNLSGGQQQQLAIGRALVLEPKLLILDEPTEGIQPNVVHEIGDIILRLNKEEGLTVLLVEQKLPFARRVASEFCILDKGRRVAAGPIGELTDEVVLAHLSV